MCVCVCVCVCVCSNLLHHTRILNLYAEENAIDDATYFLGEALRKEAITLDVFLKVNSCFVVSFVINYVIKSGRPN